jgi:hypothetical protein
MRFQIKNTWSVGSYAALVLTLYGCGGAFDDITTNAYQGAGSSWSLTSSSDGSCTLTEADSNLRVNAFCSKLSSGFTQITVISATGNGSSSSAALPVYGDVTYAFEVDGYMMPFKAFGEGKVVPTVTAGTCASSLNHNYVVSFAKLGNNADFTGWSTMGNYALSNRNLHLNRYKANGDFIQTDDQTLDTSTCVNGVWTNTSNGDLTRLYFTQNGGAIFHRDSSNSNQNGQSTENNFMLPNANDVSSLAGLDGNYIGFVIRSKSDDTFETQTVAVTAKNGGFAVSQLSGQNLGTTTAGHSSFTLTNQVSASLYRGSLTHTNTGGSIGCAINSNVANQKIVICSGIDPADTTNKTLFSVILKSAS